MEISVPKTASTNSDATGEDEDQEEGGEGDIGGVEGAEGAFGSFMKQKEYIKEDSQPETFSDSSDFIFCGKKRTKDADKLVI